MYQVIHEVSHVVEADQILRRYRQGERDFSRLDLRGLSFQGCDLSGADFSQADLRGTNFRRSMLRGVNFMGAKTGLRFRGIFCLILGLIAIAVLLGVSAGIMATIVNLRIRVYTGPLEEVTAAWTTLLLLIGYVVISSQHGLKAGFSIFLVAFAIAIAVATAGPIITRFIHPLAFGVAFAIANAITIVSTVLAATATAVVLATGAGVAIGLGAFAIVISVFFLAFSLTVAAAQFVGSVVAVVPCIVMLTGYQCRCALRGKERHTMIRRVVMVLATCWGTSFAAADLTDANFTATRLHNVNLDDAILTRTCWTNGTRTETAQPVAGFFASSS